MRPDTTVTLTLQLYTSQEDIDIGHNAVRHELRSFLPLLLQAADLSPEELGEWTYDLSVEDTHS